MKSVNLNEKYFIRSSKKLRQNGKSVMLVICSSPMSCLKLFLTRCVSLGLVQDVLGHAAGTVQAASGQAGGH